VRRGDVDVTNATVYVRGTKNAARTRTVAVEPWAMHRLAEYLRGVPSTPTAPLFEDVTARRALDVQRQALERLGLDVRYTLHDARHSYAVRQVRAGVPLQEIARNLGHKDAVMLLRIYGKYQPDARDFARAKLRAG
jgi:integrase